MRRYCEECGREVNAKIIRKRELYTVCGEEIVVDAQVLVCSECGEEFYCEELDNQTLLNAYNEYRRKHKLLFPEEIKKIREQYGLSQRSLAKLLNWGDKTVHRYENGSIQDKAHNSLLLFLREPENMRSYIRQNEIMLDDRQKVKLLETVDALLQKEDADNTEIIADLHYSKVPTIENGFKVFDYEKFCAMVLFFAHKGGKLLKTKLLKLLNYSDTIHYKENGISISGLSYVHLPFGPVPQHYEMLFGMMDVDKIAHIEVVLENGYEKHQVIPDKEMPQDIFSAEELDVLNRVYEKFKDCGSSEISCYSHKEKGYCSTKQGEIISYSYAKEITLD